jgi:predicted  nucleic acid-binding Zn-ribbon protein
MEELQILKFSIRKSRHLIFTEGMSWSDELKEFELAARTAPLGDAEAYGRSLEEAEEESDELEDELDDLRKDLEALEEVLSVELQDDIDVEDQDQDQDIDDFYASF